MSYNAENYQRIKQAYLQKQARAKELAQARTAEVQGKLPQIFQIDMQLCQTAAKMMEAILSKDSVQEKVAAIKAENQALQAKRREILVQNGYPADYTDISYECPLCQDTGAVGTRMCSCMRQALVLCGYETSGLGSLLQTQSFDTFQLHYYKEENALRCAKAVLDRSLAFAAEFAAQNGENLLFCGKTGLGKTHLCTSIAKAVIDRGFDVIYVTAQDLFFAMEGAHFRSDPKASAQVEHYMSCDLLIIDDLGTELTNQFTISCLYNIVNSRLNQKKSMIINTNLTQGELDARYADRITSRLFGLFEPYLFLGQDIRSQKLE